MALFPLPRAGGIATYDLGFTTSAPATVTVTTGGTAHTKTGYVTLVADSGATPWYGFGLTIPAIGSSAVATGTLIDIAYGAAASEVVVMANLNFGYTSTGVFQVPLYVPPNTRISLRAQSTVLNQAMVGFDTISNTGSKLIDRELTYGYTTTYGANTGTSQGIAAANGSNADGAATQITASTTATLHALQVMVGGNAITTLSARDGYYRVFVGAGGSEVAVTPNIPFNSTTAELVGNYRWPLQRGLSIPAGTRLSVKGSLSGATTSYDVVIIGYTR